MAEKRIARDSVEFRKALAWVQEQIELEEQTRDASAYGSREYWEAEHRRTAYRRALDKLSTL